MRFHVSRLNRPTAALTAALAILITVSCLCGGTAAAPATDQAGSTEVVLEQPYNEKADPHADIAAAMAAAKTDKKNVLLDFGANWCEDCLVLSKLFEDPTVKPYLDKNFHVVHIDIGQWDRNLDVVDQYGNPTQVGIPAVVVLTPEGKMIATTKAGELANARTATAQDILTYLHKWAPE